MQRFSGSLHLDLLFANKLDYRGQRVKSKGALGRPGERGYETPRYAIRRAREPRLTRSAWLAPISERVRRGSASQANSVRRRFWRGEGTASTQKRQRIRTSVRCCRGGKASENASQDAASEGAQADNPRDSSRKAMAFSRLDVERLVREVARLTVQTCEKTCRSFLRIGLFWRCPPTPFKQRRIFV
jgi:hypothetical protein